MLTNRIFMTAARHSIRQAHQLPPLEEKRSPVFAFAAGLVLGVVGVGLYLRSWRDFLIVLAVVLAGTVFSAGLAAPVAWLFCAVYCTARVVHSNRAIDKQRADLTRLSVNVTPRVVERPSAAELPQHERHLNKLDSARRDVSVVPR